jgi:hypothetical protein
MGIRNWFRKPDREPADVSPGGSKYIHHEGGRAGPAMPAFSTLPYIERREAVYRRLFGPAAAVDDDQFPGMIPHIDVYAHEPGHEGRPFWTLVTGGMSDLPMTLPPDAPREAPVRAEVAFYLPADVSPGPEYVSFLRTCGQFVFDHQTALGPGHTIPNGQPPQPIFADAVFTTLLFLYPPFEPDCRMHEKLALDGDPVHLLWVVPLAPAEHRLKLEKGTGALLELFDAVRHPVAFDRHRESYV